MKKIEIKKVLCFGAGNIARGLLAHILIKENNIKDFVFIDVNQELIDKLNHKNEYQIFELDVNYQQKIIISDYKAISFKQFSQKKEMLLTLDTNLILTAINKINLKKIVNTLIKFIHYYNQNKFNNPIVIMCCENGKNVTSFLKDLIIKKLNYQKDLLNNFYFVDVLIDRIIPKQDDYLDLKVEKYYSWTIDKINWPNNIKKIKKAIYTKNFEYEIDKKLFMLNGLHCALAWKWLVEHPMKKSTTFASILKIKKYMNFAYHYLNEINEVLIKKYNLKNNENKQFITLIFKRYQNSLIDEPIMRLTRNTNTKLSKNERIYLPYSFAKNNFLETKYLNETLKNGYKFLKLDYKKD